MVGSNVGYILLELVDGNGLLTFGMVGGFIVMVLLFSAKVTMVMLVFVLDGVVVLN